MAVMADEMDGTTVTDEAEVTYVSFMGSMITQTCRNMIAITTDQWRDVPGRDWPVYDPSATKRGRPVRAEAEVCVDRACSLLGRFHAHQDGQILVMEVPVWVLKDMEWHEQTR